MIAGQLFRSGTFQERQLENRTAKKGIVDIVGDHVDLPVHCFPHGRVLSDRLCRRSLDRLRKSLLRKEGQCLAAYSGEAEKPRCCLDPQRETGSMLQRSALLGQRSLGSAAAHVVVLSTCKS